MQKNKHTPLIKVKKVSYFRDLGGLKTTDGKEVKYNLLYRTSHLSKLKNQKKLDKLNISTVIDLRTNEEKDSRPELDYQNITYRHLPVLTNEENPLINRHSRTEVLKRLSSLPGGTTTYLVNTYKTLVTSPAALDNYHQMLVELSNSENATIWHCTQGKDRTGVGTMILLLALGVSEEDIVNDYMSYNKHCRVKNFFIKLGMKYILFKRKLANSLMPLLSARQEFIVGALEEIKSIYNDFNSFLYNGLKLSDEVILSLKEKYLN